MILGIESSCDDTCAAVVTSTGEIKSNIIASQTVHNSFGGVVPEVAARQHLQTLNGVVDLALKEANVGFQDLAMVAVTQGPGLIGALLVGLSGAKALAGAHQLPLVPVDHLYAHVMASLLAPSTLEPPFVSLIASGGHTLLLKVDHPQQLELLGQTLDDAAGEAFDKGARLLGLPFPGGPALSKLAQDGDPTAFNFPTAARVRGLDFSFAGVKTALLYKVRELGEATAQARRADLAAAYEAAIVTALVQRAERALEQTGYSQLALGGGVAANTKLRQRLVEHGIALSVPDPALCTDNAAMIAGAARFLTPQAYPQYLGLDAYPSGASVAAK